MRTALHCDQRAGRGAEADAKRSGGRDLLPEVKEAKVLVLRTHFQAFRKALSRDRLADIEPLRMHVPDDASAGSGGRFPVKLGGVKWLGDRFTRSRETEVVHANPQAKFAGGAMAVSKDTCSPHARGLPCG